MAKFALFLALATFCYAQDSSGGSEVNGRVMSTAGEPIQGALVRLQTMRVARPGQQQTNSTGQNSSQSPPQNATGAQAESAGEIPPPPFYSTVTDASGNFVFSSVPDGRYVPFVQRSGYLSPPSGRMIEIDAGASAPLEFKLTPEGRIEGRVVDEDGEPVARVQVMVAHWAAPQGSRRLLMQGGMSSAADGSFVIGGLQPGRYYLVAEPPPEPGIYAGPKPHESYVSTYRPGVPDLASASAVNVAAGSVVQGVDIRMVKSKVYRVAGKLVDGITGDPVRGTAMSLSGEDGLVLGRMSRLTGQDGSFAFDSVSPGSYAVEARPRPAEDHAPPSLRFADQQIIVGKEDIDGLTVTLAPPATIHAHITVEGGDSPAGRTILELADVHGVRSVRPAIGSTADNMAFRDVGPGDYSLSLASRPTGAYLKSVRLDGQDATGKLLHVGGSADENLEVVLSPHAADVSGMVRNSSGDPMPQVAVTVWTAGKAADAPDFEAVIAVTDASGTFRAANLAPGEYRVAAWAVNIDALDPFARGQFMMPEFLAQFDGRAASVRVDEDSHATVDSVPSFAADAIDQAADNVR